MDYVVRRANIGDLEQLVEFTLAEAMDAEGAGKDRERARKGIRAALEDESVAMYWVVQSKTNGTLANISVTKEWSNWHAGYYWWIQSMYIKPEHRGRGLVAMLFQTVKESARQSKALDLRLCVHKDNSRAIKAYLKSGFAYSDYRIMRTDI
jgi:ribosomal protein S18 acetylase RimI-like enzyme